MEDNLSNTEPWEEVVRELLEEANDFLLVVDTFEFEVAVDLEEAEKDETWEREGEISEARVVDVGSGGISML